jgi:Fuc2NAc and GlcNAc transferase
MIALIVATFLVGVAAWMITDWARRNATRLGSVQAPNPRSSHTTPTPSAGGIGIVLASLPAIAWFAIPTAWWLVPCAAMIAAVGWLDDLRPMSRRARLATQACASAVLVFAIVVQFGGGMMGVALAAGLFMAGIWWINLFNFMDGIDGIAGTQALSMLGGALLAGALFHPESVGGPTWSMMLILCAAGLGFLWHNWAPARIFMGDTGSTYLAFMIFALALFSIHEGWLDHAFWLISGALFISDASITLIRRMLTGQAWIEAHRSHAYQKLAARWRSHARVSATCFAINQIWLAPLAWLSLIWPEWSLIWVVAAYAPIVAGVLALRAGQAEAS